MRAVVAMSGGVDSSVAALLLKEKGYDTIGVTIKTWPKEECGDEGEKLCCSLEAIQSARSVAEDIGIPYYVIDLSKEFAKIIKKYFAEEYSRGRTPNPCVYCNSKIKFGILLEKAQEMGAEKIVTGHYARVIEKKGQHYLAEGVEKKRDQSYFLYDIPRKILSLIEFPLGEMEKNRVREIATENNFMSARRKASQDVCFATAKGGYRAYLNNVDGNLFVPGKILDITGKVLGEHRGIVAYTIGQRHGLGLGFHEPLYVLKIDPNNNTITVGAKEHLMKKKIRVSGFNWLIIDKLDEKKEFETLIRYNGEKVMSTVTPEDNDAAIVEFSESQFAPTPGQAAVFYKGEIVAGGGWIEEVLQ